jgi:hypothetical protein
LTVTVNRFSEVLWKCFSAGTATFHLADNKHFIWPNNWETPVTQRAKEKSRPIIYFDSETPLLYE